MHYMHDLKDLLCAELEDYAEKGKKSGKLSMGDLESIHKLTDTVKNIMKIDVLKEEVGYSEDGHYMGEGRIYGTSYESGYSDRGGSSYARGRGRYAKRDSMGRYSGRGGMSYDDDVSYASGGRMGNRGGYSRDDGKHYMMEQLEDMMEEAEKPAEKEALRRCMDALKRA
jgi:hypothetical protein